MSSANKISELLRRWRFVLFGSEAVSVVLAVVASISLSTVAEHRGLRVYLWTLLPAAAGILFVEWQRRDMVSYLNKSASDMFDIVMAAPRAMLPSDAVLYLYTFAGEKALRRFSATSKGQTVHRTPEYTLPDQVTDQSVRQQQVVTSEDFEALTPSATRFEAAIPIVGDTGVAGVVVVESNSSISRETLERIRVHLTNATPLVHFVSQVSSARL